MNYSVISDYLSDRNRVIHQENDSFLGGKVILNENESKFDNLLMQLKNEELELSYKDTTKFLPKLNFLNAKDKIDQSKLFKLLRNIPKGHSLHTHLLASASVDFIIKNITYKENVYGKYIREIYKVKFMKPEEAQQEQWTSLKEMRQKDKNFDNFLKAQFRLVPENPELPVSIEFIWMKFKKTFSAVFDMLSYKPAFEEFYYQCLKELYEDNVMYCEFKAIPMPLYDLEGTVYQTEDFFKLLLEIEEKFKKDHEGFFGARYIQAIYRGLSIEDIKEDLIVVRNLKKKFPKLIVGIDFVGFEEEGHTLFELQKELNDVKDLHFYFHAGETSWYGHTDMNLIDAILLNSKRLGHAFALSKHPVLQDLVLKQNIAIEHCPISNQVLCLNDDPRNHPVIGFLAKGFPVVVCNDDPSSWGASGLSYDWYVTFLAMTPRNYGLKFLKQLALNSIKFSALDDEDKSKALELWTKQWNASISKMANTK